MSPARYVLGLIALACVVASLGAGAVGLRSMFLPQLRGVVARLAEVVLCVALLTGILEFLGTVRLFRFAPVVFVSVAVGLWLSRRSAPERGRCGHRPRVRRSATWRVIIPMMAVAVVMAEWMGSTVQSYQRGILGLDSMWYHLPLAASFAQTGQITSIRFTDVEYLTGFYPATSELVHAFGIVLMGDDVLSPAINLVWLGLALLAAWCVGESRAVGGASLIGGALALALPMMFFSNAGSADTDVAGVFCALAAVALWLHGNKTADHRVSVVGGVAAGLAVSMKLTLVAPMLALTAAVIMQLPREHRRGIASLWLAAVGGAGGFWYLRNLIAVGNPFPWFSLGVLPTPHSPLQQHTSFTIADYLRYPTILRDVFAPALADGLGPWWVVILAVAVVGPLSCVAAGRDRVVRIAGVVALVSLAGYLVTPGTASGPFGHPVGFHLNLRYAAPALALALTVGPLALSGAGKRWQWAFLCGLAAIFAATVAQQRLWAGAYGGSGLLVPAVLLLTPSGAALGLRGLARSSAIRNRVAAGVGATLVLLGGATAGYAEQHQYIRDRYTADHALRSLAPLWQWARTVQHARIALVGTLGAFFTYPLLGIDDSNNVDYLGHHGPHGSFTPITNCPEWRRALNAGHYRYVVTTASRDVWTHALSFSPEGDWTREDPAARSVIPRAADAPIAVYRLRGQLDPDRCPDSRGFGGSRKVGSRRRPGSTGW
jgi:hypothetical protein